MPIINQVVKGSGGSAPAHYIEKTVDANGILQSGAASGINLSGVTTLGATALCYAAYESGSRITGAALTNTESFTSINGDFALSHAFGGCSAITSTGLNNVTTISGTSVMHTAFKDCVALTTTGLGSVTVISASGNTPFSYAFSGCIGITSTGLNNLTTLNLRAGDYQAFQESFKGCTALTDIGFQKVQSLTNTLLNTFENCTSLEQFDFEKLETGGTAASTDPLFDGTFKGCTSLKTARFTKLTNVVGYLTYSNAKVFNGCVKLENVYFNGLKSTSFQGTGSKVWNGWFNNTVGSQAPNGCTVHFPSNFDPSDPDHTFDASTLTGYPTFGGDAQYIHVAFDLPATE